MPYTAKGKCVYRKDTGKKIGCTKGSVKKYLAALHANVKDVNESEEFDWVELPELPKDNDFISSVKYALEGSLYDLHIYTTGQLVNRDYHLVNLVELRKGNQTLFRKGLEYFTPENVKKEFNNVFTSIKNQGKMLGPGSISHNPERFPDLSSKMGKVHKLYFDAYELLKDLLPKNGINESEEWYDEVLTEKPSLRFDDIMVGDILSNDYQKDATSKFDTTYFHVLSFEDGKTWRNAYEEAEKYVVCSLVKEDPGTGNFIPVSRTDIKFPRGKNIPMWTLVYREGVVESIKESEDEFEWVNDIKLTLGFDDLKLGDVVRLKDYDNNNWEVIDIYMSDPSTTGRPSEKRIKFRIPFRNSQLELWKSPLNSENYFELVNRNPDRVYFNVNESEDEFDWIQDLTKYLKVGQEFSVTRQSGGEPFNAKIIRLKTKPNPLYTVFYFVPSSMAKPNTKLFGTPMTAQKLLELMELGYWTPVEGNINESEDEFGWAQEIVKNSFLEFNGKEVFIDIRGGDSGPLNGEELKKLYDIVKPYINKGNRFINHEGEEILWMDNRKCFEDIVAQGRTGKFLSISLHCGIEDNDFLPLKGAICCLRNTYEEEANTDKEYIISVNAREIIGGTINESEWFEDVVKDPIMLKVEELEMGDIVIPTRFNQQEYIVTGKGTSVKLLHEPTHWVTLKRNTKANTGGVFIEHDSEIGKACRFELIHREENLNESEEDSELFWAQDLLKGIQESVDITDKLDIIEELPIGSILQVRGYQDEMELDMEEVKLIDKAPSTYYLFKLKKERFSDGSEMTHCGTGEKHRKICECREGTDDDLGQTEVGKCWWIELKKQDQVLYYPNRVDLTENKIKKPLLTEGRYDAITRKVVRDIMKAVTEGDSDSYNLPWDIWFTHDYEQEGLSFNLELDIVRSEEVDSFEVRTAIADEDEENVIMMTIILGPGFSTQKLQKLFYKLQEDIRHEIEHFTQMGPNRIEDRPTYKGSTANLKTTYGHHKNVIEVPALVHGFYRRAKLEKRPIDEIMMDDLDAEIERGLLTKTQAQKLLTLWLDYAKKNLPAAIYKQD